MAGRDLERFTTCERFREDLDVDIAQVLDLLLADPLRDKGLFHLGYLGCRDLLKHLGEPGLLSLGGDPLVQAADDLL